MIIQKIFPSSRSLIKSSELSHSQFTKIRTWLFLEVIIKPTAYSTFLSANHKARNDLFILYCFYMIFPPWFVSNYVFLMLWPCIEEAENKVELGK
jgi:hypothetical protein